MKSLNKAFPAITVHGRNNERGQDVCWGEGGEWFLFFLTQQPRHKSTFTFI